MNKKRLPRLISIKVEHYSLYRQSPTFEFSFLDGLSAIIGGNGIGKTTFVELVLYCLLGHRKIYQVVSKKKVKTKEKVIDPNFFISRMNDSYERNTEASAFLEYSISGNKIVVGRNLYLNKIIYLNVNNEELTENIDDEHYENLILQFTGFGNFQAFDDIVRKFLFFDEGRKNIAWDPDIQDELLRILFFDEEYLSKFEQLEEEVVYLDTRGRHKSEDKRVETGSLDGLIEERRKLYQELNPDTNIDDSDVVKIIEQKSQVEQERDELQVELEETIEEFEEINRILNNVIGEKNELLMSAEAISNDIAKLEAKLFSSIYNLLPEYYISLERVLSAEGKCLACGSKSKEIRESALMHKRNNECIICSSQLQDVGEYDPNIIDQVNAESTKRTELTIKAKNKELQISELTERLNATNIRIQVIRDQLNLKHREIIYIDSLLAKNNLVHGADTYAQIIEVKQRRIEELGKEVEEIYRMRDAKKGELKKLHNEFTNLLVALNKHLSQYFNKYASTFLGFDCELVVETKTIKKIPHVQYLPKLRGSIREGITSVSESQRFFLDQAFRMAIIDYLQDNIDGFRTFFITETPEGSLDIVYETQVAAMFNLFAKSSNNIIFTSNLNSSNFLLKLFENMGFTERKARTLNLLDKGNPTKLQMESKDLARIHDLILGSE